MLNRILHIILSILIFANLTIISVSASENAQIIVSSATIEKGTSNVDITISLKNNPGIVSAKFTVDFNSDALILTTVTDAGVLGNTSHSPTFDSPYTLYWNNATSTTDFKSNDTIVTLGFQIKENASTGNYPIYISYDEDNVLNLDMDNVFFETVNGNINIKEVQSGVENGMIVSGISFNVSLSGDTSVGTVYAALYDTNGKLNHIKTYPASDIVNVVFDVGMTGAYAKIMWWDNNMKPLCNSQTIPLQ